MGTQLLVSAAEKVVVSPKQIRTTATVESLGGRGNSKFGFGLLLRCHEDIDKHPVHSCKIVEVWG